MTGQLLPYADLQVSGDLFGSQLALNERMRAMPFAGVFVKFDALRCLASKVRDPFSVSVLCYQILLVGRTFQVRAEDALHFKANVETETHRSRKLSIPFSLQRGTISQHLR